MSAVEREVYDLTIDDPLPPGIIEGAEVVLWEDEVSADVSAWTMPGGSVVCVGPSADLFLDSGPTLMWRVIASLCGVCPVCSATIELGLASAARMEHEAWCPVSDAGMARLTGMGADYAIASASPLGGRPREWRLRPLRPAEGGAAA